MSLPPEIPGTISFADAAGGDFTRPPPRIDVASAQLWSCQDFCSVLASILSLNGVDYNTERYGTLDQQIQIWERGLLQMFNTIQSARAEVSVLENLVRQGGDASAWRMAAQYEMRKSCARFVSLLQTTTPDHNLHPRTFYEWMEDFVACRVPGHPMMELCDPKEAIAFCMDTHKELPLSEGGEHRNSSNALLGYILDVATLTFPEMSLELNCQNMFELTRRLESLTLYQQLTLARVCKYLDLAVLARCIDNFHGQQRQRPLSVLQPHTLVHIREQWDFAEKFACALYKSIFRRLSPETLRTTPLPMVGLYSIKGLMGLMPSLYRQDEIATVLRRHKQNLSAVGAVIPYMVTDEQNRVLCEPLRSDSGAIGLLMQGEKVGRMWVLRAHRTGHHYLLQTLLYHTQISGRAGAIVLPPNTPAVMWRYSKIVAGQAPQWRVFNTVKAKSGLESLLENLFGGQSGGGVGPVYFYEWGLAPCTVPVFASPDPAAVIADRELLSKVFNPPPPPPPPPPTVPGRAQMSSINILKHKLMDVESGKTDSSRPSQSKRLDAWLSEVVESGSVGLVSRGSDGGTDDGGGPSNPPPVPPPPEPSSDACPPTAAALSRANEAEGLSCNTGVSM